MKTFTTRYENEIDLDALRDRLNVACGNGKADLTTFQQAREVVESLRYASETYAWLKSAHEINP